MASLQLAARKWAWRHIVEVFHVPWPWLLTFLTENWHSTYSCRGKRVYQFWFSTFFVVQLRARTGETDVRRTDGQRCVTWPIGQPHNELLLGTANLSHYCKALPVLYIIDIIDQWTLLSCRKFITSDNIVLRVLVRLKGNVVSDFYPRDAMLARVFAIATCPSVCQSVCPSGRPSHAGIVPSRAKAGSWNVHHLIAPWL